MVRLQGMAEVGTVLQLVSEVEDSWESLALHHDPVSTQDLRRRFPHLGDEILSHRVLELEIQGGDMGCERWCDCLLGPASPQQASLG